MNEELSKAAFLIHTSSFIRFLLVRSAGSAPAPPAWHTGTLLLTPRPDDESMKDEV
jgi:hypothetical protein